jgi:magnesium chelatase subunit D
VPGDTLQSGPYPEDDPGAVAEYVSLRETWQLGRRPRAKRGHVIGIEPTRRLSDMAVVPTAFEAAKFQALRRERSLRMHPGLIIFGSDLRRYRYLARPDTAVVLVLDHTCRREWDFEPSLAPYLRWAYVRRAVISVVEFGHRGAANELCATAYRTSSVLDRRVAVSLGRASGRATPLAHALDLAVQEMRRHLRQDEVVADNSWLIVVSDGRGNVPLEASQRGLITGLVAREGVTDALRAARAMRALPGVHKVVLAPPKLTHYARLPFDLANAMGGIVAEDAQ